ncbi:hypothetical protein [Streptacidiphilus neutrinimicus]|uniref:hypothetical protein n=1 Tax=Streptacidiphilus neutrinimicus TaxID=105420 RepID=UPI0006935201|nr:hypothetical protein [Streptacidiphilus neutrinimicus]
MNLQPGPASTTRVDGPTVNPSAGSAHGAADANAVQGRGSAALLARGVAIVALAGTALVHLVQLPDTAHQMPGLAVLFAGLALTAAGLAVALVRTDSPRLWQATALTAGAALGGYVLTRSTAVPFDNGDVGNWLEPLGLAALFIEGALLALCCFRLRLGPATAPARGTTL